MTTIDIVILTVTVGAAGCLLAALIQHLLYKYRLINSFQIVDNKEIILIKNNRTNLLLKAVGRFFLYSLLTFIVAGNSSKTNLHWQLLAIYVVCFLFALAQLYIEDRFRVEISKTNQTIRIGNDETKYDKTFELKILGQPAWLTENQDYYGLFLKHENKNAILVFGYSFFEEIEQLKKELETITKL